MTGIPLGLSLWQRERRGAWFRHDGLVLSGELSDSRLFRSRLVDKPVGGDSAQNQAAEWENPTSFREKQEKDVRLSFLTIRLRVGPFRARGPGAG